MALLLCTREAKTPFYNDKLDIRLWSMQELCYVIYNHPLLVFEDFVSAELILWLRDELSQGLLAARLTQLLAASAAAEEDCTEEALIMILQDCNYYTPGEIEACRRRLSALRGAEPADYAHALGRSLFHIRRYRMAEESFRKELAALDEPLKKAESESLKKQIARRKAEVLCDIASARVQLFDEAGALTVLGEADEVLPVERAAKMRYLLRAAEDDVVTEEAVAESLSDEMRKELDLKREEARMKARSSAAYRELLGIFEQDAVKREALCTELLKKWKKEYRRMI